MHQLKDKKTEWTQALSNEGHHLLFYKEKMKKMGGCLYAL